MSTARRLTALVTGASSGIGEALARELAARGHRLVLASENAPELERVRKSLAAAAGGEPVTLPADLSVPGEAERLHRRCRELGLAVDLLVNCAGILLVVERELAEPEAAERLLTLHVHTPTRLCLLFGQDMIARGGGYILNVGSISSLFPDPSSLTYGPSKRYLLAFSDSLHLQWREHGVRVTTVLPGGVRTGFFASHGVYVPRLVTDRLMTPERCARVALRALFRGRRRVIPGLTARLQVALFQLLLTPALYGFSKRLYARLSAGGTPR